MSIRASFTHIIVWAMTVNKLRATVLSCIATAALAGVACNGGGSPSGDPASAVATAAPKTIAVDQIGAAAGSQYKGDGLKVEPTPAGARLRSDFQKLNGDATRGGLWVTSTVPGEDARLRLMATGVGRGDQTTRLAGSGTVTRREGVVSFARRGLTEEYSTGVDGVRQDFILDSRPSGTGTLHVDLTLAGARAAQATRGATLTLDGSGRELAYSRLHVADASGRTLTASLNVIAPNRLAVRVDDADAVYPVRIDPTFSDADWVSLNPNVAGTNNAVNTIATDASNNIYIGGNFTFVGTVAANNIAKWDGSVWTALGTGTGGGVSTIATSGTDVYVGGSFGSIGGVANTSRIAKWNGSAWSALGTGANDTVSVLMVADGLLYAGGAFTTMGGVTVGRLATWNGTAWSAFGGSGASGNVSALAKIGTSVYMGCGCATAGGVTINNIGRWDGTSWNTLRTGSSGAVQAFAVVGNNLYAGANGAITLTAGGSSSLAIWNQTTFAWTAVGPNAPGGINAILVNGSDVYIGGTFPTAPSGTVNQIAKWNGTSWSSLGSGTEGNLPGQSPSVVGLKMIGTDLYAVGSFLSMGGTAARGLAKWDGTAWSTLGGSGLHNNVNAIVTSGTTLYIAGNFISAPNGTTVNRIAKWDGSTWSALGTGVNHLVNALAVDASGNLYAGGRFGIAGGVTASLIAKWNGTAWSAMGSGISGNVAVNAIAVNSAGDVFAGGNFTGAAAGGVPNTNRVAKWNGSAWSALGTGFADGLVSAITTIGTDVFVGGSFTLAGALPVNRIAKWDGTGWSALGTGMNANVNALTTSGTDLYAGGGFTTAGGGAALRVAKWNGSAWSALGGGVAGTVNAVAVDTGGRLYVGGGSIMAKWDGSAWSTLGSGVPGTVLALAADASGHLFVGGSFTKVGAGLTSPFLARADVNVNHAPVANAGADQAVAATSASGATVVLNGAASSDPDGDTLTYSWTNDFDGTTLSGATPSMTVPLGAHVFTLTVTDTGGMTHTDTVILTVSDALTISSVTPPIVPATYTFGQVVPASYSCTSSAGILASCVGTVANGSPINTGSLGVHTFDVTATNTLGNSSTSGWTYNVAQASSVVTVTCPTSVTYTGAAQTPCTAAATGAGMAPVDVSASLMYVNNINVGTVTVSASWAGDANHTGSADLGNFAIVTAPVTATFTANSKVYDGTTAAPAPGLSCSLSGVFAGDIGNVVCTPSAGTFDSANVGSPRTVTATLTLSGSAVGNYTFGAPGTTTLTTTAVNAATSTTASAVYGQAGSFLTDTINTGGLSAVSLASPRGVAADAAGNIYVADRDNHRVLFFPFGQTTATRVYGQGGSFTSNTPNNGGVSANSLNTPNRVTVDSTGLYVSDALNNRVLYFPGTSTTATRVYGQGGSFTSNVANTGGISADSLGSTRAMAVDSAGNLYIADGGNHRILFYPAGSTTATRVYGQQGNFTTNTANNGGVSAISLNAPNGIRLDTAGNLYVADQNNHRLLVYPAGQTTATVVYGQGGNFTTNTANNGGISATSINLPANLAVDGGNNVYLADSSNNRILFYPSGQTTATAVYGQGGSFVSNTINNGGVSADSLRAPNSVDLDFAGNIYISDQGNNRVLRFSGSAPAITPASLVVTASSPTKTYGTTASVSPSYLGFVNGETTAVLSSMATCSSAGTAASAPAGTYAVTCTGAAGDNYSVSYVAGTLTVEQAPASVTPNAASKVYGTLDPVLTGTLSGFLPGDSVTATYARSAGETVAGGPYTISATLSPVGVLGNYAITYNTAAFTILKANQTLSLAASPSDGVPDTAFSLATGTGFNARTIGAAVQADGKIIVGGTFSSFNGVAANLIARLNADGTRDAGFTTGGTGFDSNVNSVAVQADGKIVVGGNFQVLNGSPTNFIARLSSSGAPDSAFITNTGTGFGSGQVMVVAVQPDGKILAGGFFTTLNGVSANRLARLNANGTPDTAFRTNLGTGFNGDIRRLVLQPDGKILVVGNFTALNGATVRGVARVNADGTPDTVFNANTGAGMAGGGENLAIAVQSTGKVVVGGSFTQLNGVVVNGIGRLNADGTPDTSFVATGLNATSLAVQADDKIVATGGSKGVTRLNADGTSDTAFVANLGTGLNGPPENIVLAPDGTVILVDSFTSLNGATANRIARLLAGSGAITKTYGDAAFTVSASASSGLSVSFSSTTPAVCTVAGNTVTIVGAGACTIAADQAGDTNYHAAATVNQNVTVNKATASVTPGVATKIYGAVDPAFTGTLSGFLLEDGVTATYTRTTGETVAGGPYTISATLSPAGVLGNYTITYNTANFTITQATASVTPNAASKTYGAADPVFTGTLSGFLVADGVTATYTRTAGETVAGGPYTISATLSPAGILANYAITSNTAPFTIAKANQAITGVPSNGTPDTAFSTATGTGFNARAIGAAVQADGKILVGGTFATFNGVAAPFFARLNADGSRDAGFSTGGTGFNSNVNGITVQPDGKMIVAGAFSQLNGAAVGNIARLDADGTPDAAFTTNIGAGFDEQVMASVVQPDGKIVVVGLFTTLKGLAARRVGRLNADGTPDNVFRVNTGTGFNGDIRRLVIQPDGKIVVVGNFTTLNGVTAVGVARLNADGTPDIAFNANLGTGFTGGQQLHIGLQSTGKIVVGGTFTHLNGVPTGGIARLNANGTPDTAFTVNTGTGIAATSIAVQTDDKIIASGTAKFVTRLNADGTPDTAFNTNLGTGLNGSPENIVLAPDGSVVLVDSFTSLNGVTANRIARLRSAGVSPKTYGDAPFAATATATSGLAVAFASTTPAVCTVSGSTVTIVAAGTCTLTADQAGNGNYNAAPQVSLSFTVDRASVAATLLAAGKTYDGTTAEPNASMSCTLAGVLPADSGNVTCTATGGTFNLATVGSRTVTATVTISGTAVSNYTLGAAGTSTLSASTTATASITGQPVTASIAAANKTYDGNANATITSCTLSGVVGADAVACAASGTAANNQFNSPSVGAGKTVTAIGLTLTGAAAGNYTLASTTATTTASITTAALTATLTAANKTYDGTTAEPDASMTCSLTGVLAGDTATVACTATSGTFNLATVGSRTVTATVTISGTAAGNYTLGAAGTATSSTSKTATASITAKSVTANVTAANKTYNGNANATISSCTLTGVVSPDTTGCAASAVASNNQFDSASVGTGKTVTASGITLTNNAAGNYALASATATTTANITTAALTTTLTAASKVYDGTATEPDASMSCAVTGVVAADMPNVACTASNGSFDAATVGAGTVTATVAISGSASGNYTLGAAGTSVSSTTKSVMTNDTADAVYGQVGLFTTSTANNGGLSDTSLLTPVAVAIDRSGNVYATDQGNNRVLFFPAGSTTATRVYGQGGSFVSGGVNTGGVSADSLSLPIGVAVDDTGVYIADSGNHRVLFYAGSSTTATRVYGQLGNFTTNAQRTGPHRGLRSPYGVLLDGTGNLYVSDPGNARVLFFPAGSTTPTRVYGQGNNLDSAINNYPSNNSLLPTNQGFVGPAGIALDRDENLYVVDKFNNRVLFFPNGTTLPTRVYGQGGSFTTQTLGASADLLGQPESVVVDNGGNVYVSDRFNHRVLFYTPGSTTATRVYGQAGSFTLSHSGGALVTTNAGSFANPYGIALDANGSLFVADGSFNRLLRFDVAPPVITAAPLTVTLTAAGKTYDGTTSEPNAGMTCAVAGVLAADSGNVTCSATNGTFDSATPGARTVTATVTISGTASGNYTLGGAGTYASSSSATASATIGKANATITVTGYSVTFDGAAHTVMGTATGVGGVDLSTLLHLGATTHTNAGAYLEDEWTFDGDANYAASSGIVENIIAKASSTTTLTCSPVTTVYTGAAQELCAATVTGVGGLSLTPAPVYTDNINVGTATASYAYAGDANHDVSDDSATFAITKAGSTTTVTCSPVTTVYTGAAQELCAATVTGVGGLSLTPAPVYTDNTNVGTATASYSYAGDANHDVSDDSATFAITKATSTTTVTCSPVTTVYTGAAQELCAATVTGVGGLSLTPTPVYTDNTNVGTATASYSYAGDANHDVSDDSATFAITKATSTTTVTCSPVTTVYTGAAQELCAATVTGVGGLSLTPTPTYTDNTNVGTATASYSYAGDANHDVSDDSATFAITKATSTTTVTCSPVTTVYTGAAQELCAATVTGVGGLSLTPAPTYSDNTNVGTATASYSYAGDANHDVSDDSATFAITKAGSTTTVTCSPVTTVYTGVAQELCAATVTGVGGLSLTPTPVYTDNTNVGTATASYSYAGDANHDVSDDSATFAITKATSTTTVTCSPVTMVYTGAAQELCAATVTGVGGLSLTPAPVYTDNINVGTATASYAYAGDANHDVSDDSATFAITKATSTTTVTCSPVTTVYTGVAQEICAATVTGVGGLSLAPTPTYTANTNVGTATASYSYAGDANHDVSDDSATFAITKATSTTTVTCSPVTTVYTGAAQELCAATVTGVGGLSLAPTPVYTDNTNVGTATASYSYAGDANHDASDDSATFAITKAGSTTTVTCSPVTTVYTGAAQELCAATVTGVGGLSLTPTPVYTDNTNVGTATASYSYTGDANHDVSDDSATFAITKASSTTTVTCSPVTTVYTGVAQELCAATVTGVGGLSLTPTPVYTDNTNVGTATASYSYAGDANHDISDDSATFAITKAGSTTTVTCSPVTTVYTGAAQELCAATVTGVGGLSLTPAPVYTDNTNVGTATASYAYAGDVNHDVSDDSAAFAITKAASTTTVTCSTATTVYTGAAQELCAATVTGVGGLSLTPTPVYADNTNVGTATASYSYVGDANHDVSDDSATFAITKASSTTTVTCSPLTTVYTGAAQELCAATVTGVGGLSLTPAPVYTDNTNVGMATASYAYAGDANHDISDDSATFAITKATSTTTVTCSTATTVYTGVAQELCAATVTGVGGLSLTPTPVYADNTNVGTATASYSYAGDANHDVSDDSAAFAITKATSTTTVTCSPVTTVYTGVAQELCAATVTGVGGLSLTPTPVYTDNTNVGTATASYSYAGDANHDVSDDSATFAITKATSTTTVTCSPVTTVYTGAAQELCAATVTGVGGLSLTPTPTYTDNTNVGTATASYSYAGDANHDVSDDSATFAITKASSTTTVTCSPVTTVYTGVAQELCAATVTGVGGLSLAPTPVYADNTNVGTATASYAYIGGDNHEASTNSASFAISAAALSVTADSFTRSHLAADPLLTGTLTGVLGADGITATYSSPGTGSQVAGVYPTIPALVDPNNKVGNYAVTSANGTLTIVNANVAPVCSLTPSITSIWPVNQQMVSVTASGATDANGGPLTYRVVSIFQDESTSGTVDGTGIGTSTAQVRAERDGNGNGRVYHITFSVTDNTALSCQATVTVRVPHSPNGPAVDGGPLNDSTVATAKSEKSKKSKKSGKSDKSDKSDKDNKSGKDKKSEKSGNSPKSGGKSDKAPAPKASTPKGKK